MYGIVFTIYIIALVEAYIINISSRHDWGFRDKHLKMTCLQCLLDSGYDTNNRFNLILILFTIIYLISAKTKQSYIVIYKLGISV